MKDVLNHAEARETGEMSDGTVYRCLCCGRITATPQLECECMSQGIFDIFGLGPRRCPRCRRCQKHCTCRTAPHLLSNGSRHDIGRQCVRVLFLGETA
jgi:hypothetical protein